MDRRPISIDADGGAEMAMQRCRPVQIGVGCERAWPSSRRPEQSRVLWASKGEIDSNGGRHDGVLLYLLCVWTVAARGTWLYLNRGKVT